MNIKHKTCNLRLQKQNDNFNMQQQKLHKLAEQNEIFVQACRQTEKEEETKRISFRQSKNKKRMYHNLTKKNKHEKLKNVFV